MRIWAVSVNTFKETLRNKVLLNILIFAIFLILFSFIVGDWSMGHQVKVIKDIGLSAMSIFGLLIAIFIGIQLVIQELKEKTIYLIASKPVKRWEIIIGKYVGLSITLLINIILMSIALWCIDYFMEGSVDFSLIPAIILIYIEILLIVAFSLLFSSFTSPTLSAIYTLVVFILGHLSPFLRDYVEIYPDKGFHWLIEIIYYVVPNFDNLNLKITVVEGLEMPQHFLSYGLLYGLLYISLVLLITCFVFSKKDFK
ncbi:MAG: ABC transporter permease subunit [bacterium]